MGRSAISISGTSINATNLGTGSGVFAQIAPENNLNFKSIKGNGILITNTISEIEISGDGVVSGGTLNGDILELNRTIGLSDVTVDLGSISSSVPVSALTDGSNITFDFNNYHFGLKTLTTTNTTITLTLTNLIAGANQMLNIIKNTASDVTITLAGTGLTFYGYDNADLNTTPNIVLSGAIGDVFDISFAPVSSTLVGVAIGRNGN